MVGMRWSIIRLIWLRELRDQLRDRRTLFMVAGLPVLLYPILGVAVLKFAVGFVDRKTTVGLVNGPGQPHEFPPPQPQPPQAALQVAGWLTQPPGLAQALAVVALAKADRMAKKVPLDAPWMAKRAAEWDSRSVAWWLERNGIRTPLARNLFEMAVRGLFTVEPRGTSWVPLVSGSWWRLKTSTWALTRTGSVSK